MLKHLTKFLGPAMKHSLAVTISITQRAKFTQPPFLSLLSLVPHRQTYFNDSDCEKI